MAPGSAGSGKGKEQKLVVVGSGGVGKSALTIRFVTSQFYDQGYNPTIEDSYRKQVVVDDEAVTLEILDTAGQEEYAVMADQWYSFGTGFLLVYSITDRPTFDAIASFHQDILRLKDRVYVPCVVVCNKCDLSRLRGVGQAEGRELARSLSAPFIECSAADGVNVDVAFRELVKLVRKEERRAHLRAMTPPSSAQNTYIDPHARRELRDRDRYERERERYRGLEGYGGGSGNRDGHRPSVSDSSRSWTGVESRVTGSRHIIASTSGNSSGGSPRSDGGRGRERDRLREKEKGKDSEGVGNCRCIVM